MPATENTTSTTPLLSKPLKSILKSSDRLTVAPDRSSMASRSAKQSVRWAKPIATGGASESGEEYKPNSGPNPLLEARTHYPLPPRRSSSCRPQANTSAKMTYPSPSAFSKPRPHLRASKTPPRVPEAPGSRNPPPTPRPSRLLTPDLPEIDGSLFYSPLEPSKKRVMSSKMDEQRKSKYVTC
jgi:hypothetical protein